MSSKEIHMAFYCSHMSLHLVQANNDFMIYGPVIMNAEVILYKKEIEKVNKVGISQNRKHLYKILRESYSNIEEIIEVSTAALPYSLESEQIDGGVLDITKASLLPRFKITPLSKEDYISYCLVVRKDILDTKEFKQFLIAYNEAIEKLNKKEVLKESLNLLEEFNDIKLQFLNLE